MLGCVFVDGHFVCFQCELQSQVRGSLLLRSPRLLFCSLLRVCVCVFMCVCERAHVLGWSRVVPVSQAVTVVRAAHVLTCARMRSALAMGTSSAICDSSSELCSKPRPTGSIPPKRVVEACWSCGHLALEGAAQQQQSWGWCQLVH